MHNASDLINLLLHLSPSHPPTSRSLSTTESCCFLFFPSPIFGGQVLSDTTLCLWLFATVPTSCTITVRHPAGSSFPIRSQKLLFPLILCWHLPPPLGWFGVQGNGLYQLTLQRLIKIGCKNTKPGMMFVRALAALYIPPSRPWQIRMVPSTCCETVLSFTNHLLSITIIN